MGPKDRMKNAGPKLRKLRWWTTSGYGSQAARGLRASCAKRVSRPLPPTTESLGSPSRLTMSASRFTVLRVLKPLCILLSNIAKIVADHECDGIAGLDVTSWGFELEIKIKRRRPLRTIEGGLQAPRRQGLLLGFTPLGGARDWLRARVRVGVVAITLVSWHRSCNPKSQWHVRFGNMGTNTAFTPGSLPFTGAGGRLNMFIDYAIGLPNATLVCKSEEVLGRQ